jgi:chromosome partitioning protein
MRTNFDEVILTRTLCIANQKGGVGKTTTAINLASGLARSGKVTLLVDLDPQCNATSGLGKAPVSRHPLLEQSPIRNCTFETGNEKLSLLPGSRSFGDISQLAQLNTTKSTAVADHLMQGTGLFDFVVIDCPPSLGALTRTALATSTEVLMPIQCEYFAMEGLTQMIELIRDVMNSRPGALAFGGILLTMYDANLELTSEVDQQVREFFGEIVFDTVIPRDVAVSEAPSHGLSVIDYSPRSRGSRAYMEFCMEVLDYE